MAGSRLVGHIRRQTLGGRQSRALADQEHDDRGIEDLADVVQDADARVTDQERLAELPACAAQLVLLSNGKKAGT